MPSIYAISFIFVFLSMFIFLRKRKDTQEFLIIRPDRETQFIFNNNSYLKDN